MPQSYSRVLVHAVFSTKHRVPLLSSEVRAELHPYLSGLLKDIDCQPLISGGVEDHVHLLFALSRTVSQAQALKHVKEKSSYWLTSRWRECRGFAWQPGYAIASVDARSPAAVVRYIEGQENHHKRVSFLDELTEFVARLGFVLDERDL